MGAAAALLDRHSLRLSSFAEAATLLKARCEELGYVLIHDEAEIAVDVRNVSRYFGDVCALNSVSLSIRKGEFFSLLGPSGCGKTTLLRSIGGFERPTSGDLLIGGKSIIDQPPYARSTNMVFQHLALFPHLNVFDNIAFGPRMKGVAKDVIARKIQDILSLVRLEGYERRLPDQLSGGQKQRVAIARALVNAPSVLLLDEPLGALDLQLRVQMTVELRRLHRSLGNTFIFVTHDQGEALTMSDRIAVMEEGRLQQVGTPEEIYERPSTLFVAQFVGRNNIFEGTVIKSGGHNRYLIDADGIRIACRSRTDLALGARVKLAIRNERVAVEHDDRMSGEPNEVLAVVTQRVYSGSTLQVEALAGAKNIAIDLPTTANNSIVALNDSVLLRWMEESVTVLAG